MAVTKELIAKNGTYTNKQGEEKTRYTKVGVKMETAKGVMYKVEALPVPFDGWIYERDLPEKQSLTINAKGGTVTLSTLEEDAPF